MSAATTPRVITRSDPTRVTIEWADGRVSTYPAPYLRGICPCAECVDEASGVRVHDPASVPPDLVQTGVELVGHYALAIRFSDGHGTGIFTFRMLREADPEA